MGKKLNLIKVMVKDGRFQIINLETREVVHKSSLSQFRRTICNESPDRCANCSFSYSHVVKQGCVAIQVEATLLCLTDPTEFFHEQQKPLDDNVLVGIKSLLTDTSFTDLTIRCANAEFKAHKAILASVACLQEDVGV